MIDWAPAQFYLFRYLERKWGPRLQNSLLCSVMWNCGCASLLLSTSEGKFISDFMLETQPPPATTTTSSRSLTTRSEENCDRCGKYSVFCQDYHNGYDWYLGEEIPYHWGVCYCLRKLKDCPFYEFLDWHICLVFVTYTVLFNTIWCASTTLEIYVIKNDKQYQYCNVMKNIWWLTWDGVKCLPAGCGQ